MFGLTDEHINKLRQVFARHTDVEKVIIYGSRAKGNYRDGSDIDFALSGSNLNLDTLLKIENELDDLLLPFNIDISILKNIENLELIKHIERVGAIFYEKQRVG